MKLSVQNDQDRDELSKDLTALSNPHRLHLLHLLTKPLYREEIADELGMSRQSASKHIEKLEDRGFLKELQGWRETGPVAEYQVNPKRLFALGMQLADLGRLEPEGGPDTNKTDNTMVLDQEHEEIRGRRREETDQTEASLLVVTGPEAGKRYKIEGEGPRWTIGRDDDRDVQIDHDPFVSGRHAEIQLDPRGHSVVDVFSSNGTMVNFGKLPKGSRTVLEQGDVIGIGRTHFVYQLRSS